MKYKILIIFILVIGVFSTTFSAFYISKTETGSIETKELSSSFLNNNDFLAQVQIIDSSITSVDKTSDLTRVNTVPTETFTIDNIVSTSSSSVPIYLWVDGGTIYYYTIATNIDLNNN